MAYDANAVAALEGILNDPFKGAPCGMHLNRFFKSAIMGHGDVRVAPAAMGKTNDIPFLMFGKGFEQFTGSVTIGANVALVLNQRVG